jgi:hypothetical protein
VLSVATADLNPIKAGLAIMQERHAEILKEKEDKIWALQNQLLASTSAEKDKLIGELNRVRATSLACNSIIYPRTEHNLVWATIAKSRKLINTTLDTAERRCSSLERDIGELKLKGKRAASALMAAAKELEAEAPAAQENEDCRELLMMRISRDASVLFRGWAAHTSGGE